MTELILRFNNPSELEELLPILTQLKIKYQLKVVRISKKNIGKKAAVITKIQSGAFNIPNLDTVMQDFNESRQDHALIGRN